MSGAQQAREPIQRHGRGLGQHRWWRRVLRPRWRGHEQRIAWGRRSAYGSFLHGQHVPWLIRCSFWYVDLLRPGLRVATRTFIVFCFKLWCSSTRPRPGMCAHSLLDSRNLRNSLAHLFCLIVRFEHLCNLRKTVFNSCDLPTRASPDLPILSSLSSQRFERLCCLLTPLCPTFLHGSCVSYAVFMY